MRDMYIAIVGLGGMGHNHLRLIRGTMEWDGVPTGGPIENLHISGSFDIREERQQFARDNGLHAYDSFEDILADPKVNIVLAATPNDVHKEVVIRSLRAGKAAFCEKPVTLNTTDLQDMIDVANETGKIFTVHQNRRWDSDYRTVKKLYDENYLGEILRIESRIPGVGGISNTWRGKPEHGGGRLLDWGVHILDQALDMIPYKIKYVTARLTHNVQQEVDDGFRAELMFENGLSYYLEVNNSTFIQLPRWYVQGMDGSAIVDDFNANGRMTRIVASQRKTPIEITLPDGCIRTMAPRGRETMRTVTEPLPVVKTDRRDIYRNLMAAILGEADQIIKHDQIMRVMKLMETIRESDRTNSVINFES